MSNFYEELSKVMSDGMTVNITIAKKGERLNVLFTAIPKDKKKEDITPFVIRGTGSEIDVAHDATALVGTAALSGMTDNSKEFLKKAGAGDAKSGTGPGLFDGKKEEVKTTLKPKQEIPKEQLQPQGEAKPAGEILQPTKTVEYPPQQAAAPSDSNPPAPSPVPPASTVAAPVPSSEPTAPPVQTDSPVNPNKDFENQGAAVAPVTEGENVGPANMEGMKQAGQQPAAAPPPTANPAPAANPAPTPPAAGSPQPPSNAW